MAADRLIRMLINMAFRRGVRQLSKGRKPDPRVAQAQKSLRMLNRNRRM